MSIDAVTKKEYTSTSGQTVYDNHAIPFLHKDDLEVWIKDNNTAGDYGAGKAVLQQTGVSSGAALTSTHPQVAKTRKPELSTSIKQIGYSIDSNGKVTLNAAPTTGSTVIISRATRDGSGKYTSFTNGSVLKASDINLALDQVRYQAQEARNGIMGGVAGADSTTADAVDTELLAEATDSAKGVVKVGTNLSISSGTVSVADATDSVKGVVKVGTNLSVSSGTVSVIDATTSAKGVVKVGSNLSVSSGTVSVADAASNVKGVLKIADNRTTDDGTVALSAKQGKALEDGKLDLAGGTMTGAIAMGTHKITGLGDPDSDQDAATKKYLTDNYYTKTAADSAFFNVSTGETIKDGEAFPDNDNTIATTAAINDRIVALVDDVGGFVPIANETSFPADNPDFADNAGTIVSIQALSTAITTGSGVTTHTITNGAGSGKNVTITGLTASTTYPAGFGLLLETTTKSGNGSATPPREYTFHRLVPKATEVEAVAAKATEIGRLGTAAAVEDMGILGTTAVVQDLDMLAVTAVIADMAMLADQTVIDDLDICADKKDDIEDCADKISEIAACAGNLTHSEDLGSIDLSSDPLTTGTTSAITTVGSNIDSVTSFFQTYKTGSSDPYGSNQEGKLWYNTDDNLLKYHNGSSWNNISDGGIDNLKEDTTPQLGGHLDLNSKNLQGDAITIESKTGTEDYITCVKDGAVTLFHDAASKLATAATGVTVTGLMSATTIDGAAGANLQLDFGTL